MECVGPWVCEMPCKMKRSPGPSPETHEARLHLAQPAQATSRLQAPPRLTRCGPLWEGVSPVKSSRPGLALVPGGPYQLWAFEDPQEVLERGLFLFLVSHVWVSCGQAHKASELDDRLCLLAAASRALRLIHTEDPGEDTSYPPWREASWMAPR